MNRRSVLLLVSCAFCACQASSSVPAPAALSRVELRELPLAQAREPGTDALPSRRYELVVGERTRPLPPALTAQLQGDTAIVWLPDHRLARFAVEGAPRLLARDVGSPPWVVDTLVVYALEVDDAAELRMWRDGVETTLARGLASAGAFRLGPEGARIFFVGARSGGVAGLWAASLEGGGARCLTNCELRTGRPWGDAFVPPPTSADGLEFTLDEVRYLTPSGQRVTRGFL